MLSDEKVVTHPWNEDNTDSFHDFLADTSIVAGNRGVMRRDSSDNCPDYQGWK